MLYLMHSDPLVYLVGCELLLDLCDDEAGTRKLASRGLGLPDVYELTGKGEIFRQSAAFPE